MCYHNDLKRETLELEMRVEGKLLAELGNTMAMIQYSSRKEIKCQIFDSYKAADDFDAKILDIFFLAYMDKLPDEPLLNHTIKETELITKFLDPILNEVLNDHDLYHDFTWTNTRSTGTEDERPDAEMVILKQRTIDYTVGYCEVKTSESSSNTIEVHDDMVKLARFGKSFVMKRIWMVDC